MQQRPPYTACPGYSEEQRAAVPPNAKPPSPLLTDIPCHPSRAYVQKDGRLQRDTPLLSEGLLVPAAAAAAAAKAVTEVTNGPSPSVAGDVCPVATFTSVWAMQESGLPIDLDPAMRRACLPVLERLIGTAKYEEYR